MSTTDDKIAGLGAVPFKVYLYLSDPAGTLAGGYDGIQVEQRLSDGTWERIDDPQLPIAVEAGRCNYVFIVPEDAERDELFRPVLVDLAEVNPDVPQTPRVGIDTTFEIILTVDELRNIWLFGIDLTDDNGNDFPDELFVHYIRTAISQLEQELDLVLIPTKLVERHDFRVREYERYLFVQLLLKPVIEVTKVRLEYPAGETIIEFPIDWVRLKNQNAQLEILPARGTFTQLLVSAGGGFLPLVFGGSEYIPDIVVVEYTGGFVLGDAGYGRQSATSPQRLPSNLKEVVGKKASFGPLNTAGDLIVGAGIANKSISIDGLSQTIGTTSSATNAGFGSRLIQYEKELKREMSVLQRYWHGGRMTVV